MEEIKTQAQETKQDEPYKSGTIRYIDSREVAEIIGKKHYNLVRDIGQYIKQLTQLNFEFTDFFIESSYKDTSGKTNKCYLVTKKGCEFIAHKLTGIKGTKFTATYINRFHEMEDALEDATGVALQKFINQQMEFNKMVADRLDWNRETPQIQDSPFRPLQSTVLEERQKKMNMLIDSIEHLYNIPRNKVLHYLYKTLESDLNMNLNCYLSVYRTETEDIDAGLFQMICTVDRIFARAVELSEDSISRKKVFG